MNKYLIPFLSQPFHTKQYRKLSRRKITCAHTYEYYALNPSKQPVHYNVFTIKNSQLYTKRSGLDVYQWYV